MGEWCISSKIAISVSDLRLRYDVLGKCREALAQA